MKNDCRQEKIFKIKIKIENNNRKFETESELSPLRNQDPFFILNERRQIWG